MDFRGEDARLPDSWRSLPVPLNSDRTRQFLTRRERLATLGVALRPAAGGVSVRVHS